MPSEVSTANSDQSIEDLKREIDEAREQQIATSAILRVISSSPTDTERIFHEIAASAARLCDAYDAGVLLCAGDHLRLVAHQGAIPVIGPIGHGRLPLSRGVLIARAVLDRQTLQVADLQAETIDYPEGSEFARQLGHRTILAVPLVRGREASGAIFIRRTVVRPFTQRQIDLVKTFADQAVIAIENARLFEAEQARTAELKESLEYQTATSVVLNIISRSPTELQPMLDAIITTAGKLCEADYAHCRLERDGQYHVMARHALNPDELESVPGMPVLADRTSVSGKVVTECRTIHVPDVLADREDTYAVNVGVPARTILGVPLVRNGKAVGVIVLFRRNVRPFTDRQIDLVTTFADQAVIAIENTRLFEAEQASKRQLQQALEYQTATSEVLNVISRSPSNLQPVLDVIVETAVRLCQADVADFRLLRNGAYHIAATTLNEPTRLRTLRDNPIAPGRNSVVGRVALERCTVHVPDIDADPEYNYAPGPNVPGMRAILGVPLLRSDEVIGAIVLFNSIVKPFTQEQIALVSTFANQALIAIENARLFEAEQTSKRELQESLQYQTATAEVLSVISRSPNQLQPVLDAITQTAARLCQADYAHFRLLRDGAYHVASSNNYDPATLKRLTPIAPGPGSIAGRVALECKTIHLPNILADATGDYTRRHGEVARTGLGVPLLKDQTVVGVIMLFRKTVHPFTERQIALVNTFAEQALIAMENTRLFEEVQARTRELTEALEQQTASSEVLSVISRSSGEVQPVFETMLANATKLCEASYGALWLREGTGFRNAAFAGELSAGFTEQWRRGVIQPGPHVPVARAAQSRKPVHIADLRQDRAYLEGNPLAVASADAGIRTLVVVPMLKEDDLVGAIAIYRKEVRPFSVKQIELLTSFAAQAVIAIENTRLLNGLRESLQQQTATADVLKVISRSAFDLQSVLDTLVEAAARLCEAEIANIWRPVGASYRLAASYGVASLTKDWLAYKDYLASVAYEPGTGSCVGRTLLEGRVVQIGDIRADPEYDQRGALASVRTMLGVPLLRDGITIGVIILVRAAVRPFTGKQIELIETFADQAVIAIENTRLFEEVQARNTDLRVALEQQTATSELLKVIGQSTFDLRPVFKALAENAVRLCQAERAFIFRFDGQFLRAVASHNASPALRSFVEQHPQAPGRGSTTARAAAERRTVHIHDVQADPEYTYASRQVDPIGTIIAIPMLLAGELLGVITIYRHEVLPFTEGQISLLETFADQAAIAIENTKLFEEVQARNRDLTALGDVGRAVSSTLDLKIVLKTIVDRAIALSGTDAGSIFYFREELGRFELGETSGLEREVAAKYRKLDIVEGQTGLSEAIAKRQPLQIPDVLKRPSNALRDAALQAGLHAALIVPLLGSEGALGALVLQRRRTGEFSSSVVSLMQSFADQSAIALENARLFEEIAQKSRELEIASQHKSQFVANMSHELRTPLAAILGYAELMQEGFYGGQSEKSMDALARIRANGKHLLGLINTVLDIAKIESGQFTLNMAEYAIESVVETVRSATESLAQNKKLALKTEVAMSLPIGVGDEQRLTQVLLNLVGNAIKFTDSGEVRVTARAVNGLFAVSVVDTGPGIPEEHRARIFDQFHQVDSSNTKAKGGTGLGLAIAKQIVEMHGGRIWVESTLGKGSTFQMELPTRAEFRKAAP